MFEQAVLPIQDEACFAEMKAAVEPFFAAEQVAQFLRKLDRAKLRVRDFEGLLAAGLLGRSSPGIYGRLADSDRGQIREWYLRLVEQVTPELRAKFLKVYAYY